MIYHTDHSSTVSIRESASSTVAYIGTIKSFGNGNLIWQDECSDQDPYAIREPEPTQEDSPEETVDFDLEVNPASQSGQTESSVFDRCGRFTSGFT